MDGACGKREAETIERKVKIMEQGGLWVHGLEDRGNGKINEFTFL